MKSQVLISQLAGRPVYSAQGRQPPLHAWGLQERLLPQHQGDSKEVLVAAPFLSKACFALEQALNPSFHAATLRHLLKLDSQLCKEQQRVLQSSLFWHSLLQQQLKVPPPCSALAAAAAQPISKHTILTAQGTRTAQPDGDTRAPRRHFVSEEQPPSSSHNSPPPH